MAPRTSLRLPTSFSHTRTLNCTFNFSTYLAPIDHSGERKIIRISDDNRNASIPQIIDQPGAPYLEAPHVETEGCLLKVLNVLCVRKTSGNHSKERVANRACINSLPNGTGFQISSEKQFLLSSGRVETANKISAAHIFLRKRSFGGRSKSQLHGNEMCQHGRYSMVSSAVVTNAIAFFRKSAPDERPRVAPPSCDEIQKWSLPAGRLRDPSLKVPL